MSDNPVQTATARLGAVSRRDRPQSPKVIADARNDLLAAHLERAIGEALNPEAPYEPLRPADRKRLAKLLRDGN